MLTAWGRLTRAPLHLSLSLENLPQKADRDKYELLCPDNTRKPVEAFRECHLARVPSHAVVARSVNGKENSIWELLYQSQVFPPAPTRYPHLLAFVGGEVSFLPSLTSCHSKSLLEPQEFTGSVACQPRLYSDQQEPRSPL